MDQLVNYEDVVDQPADIEDVVDQPADFVDIVDEPIDLVDIVDQAEDQFEDPDDSGLGYPEKPALPPKPGNLTRSISIEANE